MSKQRYLNTKIWLDPWVRQNLGPNDMLLFIYFMTNDHATASGVYEIDLGTIAFETKLNEKSILTSLERLQPKVIFQESWIVLPNSIKHQRYTNDNIYKGIVRELLSAPPAIAVLVNLPTDFECPEELSRHFKSLQDTRTTYTKTYTKTNTYSNVETTDVISRDDEDLETNSEAATLLTRQARTAFEHYLREFDANGNVFKYTEPRRTKLKIRIKEYGIEAVLTAISNAAHDDFMRGGGPQGWRATLDYIMRSNETFERCYNISENKPKSKHEIAIEAAKLREQKV